MKAIDRFGSRWRKKGQIVLNHVHKAIELLAQVSTIAIAILLTIAVVQYRKAPQQTKPPPPVSFAAVRVGQPVSLAGVDWSKNERTLLMALSDQCHFCSASAPFYQRLTKETAAQENLGLIAVFPQPANEARNYLNNLGVRIADVRQSSFDALGVMATPTLVLVNKEGIVINTWRGQLPPAKEDEVLNEFKRGANRQRS